MNIHPEFITASKEASLVAWIDQQLARVSPRKQSHRNRVLRFGWDYATPKRLGAVPQEFIGLGIDCDGGIPDSLTINEYLRGQVIGPHIDSPKFGDIVILSLLSDATMLFTPPKTFQVEPMRYQLLRRSVAVMSGPLRDVWQHETLPLEADRRLSVVFRKLIK